MRRVTRMTMHPTSEAERDRPGLHARLLPNPFPSPTVSPSHPLSGDGRSIDSTRQVILQDGHCRDCAPLTGRVYFVGIHLAGDSEPPAIGGTRAIVPSRDPTLVTIGELRFNDDGLGSTLPSTSVVEHYRWTGKPHTTPSQTQKVWGCRGLATSSVAAQRTSPGPSIAYPLPPNKSKQSPNPMNHSSDKDAPSPQPSPIPETHLYPSFQRPSSSFLRRQEPRHTHTPPTPFTPRRTHNAPPPLFPSSRAGSAPRRESRGGEGSGRPPLHRPLVPRKKVEFFLKQSNPYLKTQNNQTDPR